MDWWLLQLPNDEGNGFEILKVLLATTAIAAVKKLHTILIQGARNILLEIGRHEVVSYQVAMGAFLIHIVEGGAFQDSGAGVGAVMPLLIFLFR